MKKFTKLLVLLLTVVVIMTAFTVTILAAEGETTELQPVVKPAQWATKYYYENDELFATFVEQGYVKNSTTKAGIFLPAKAENGNKYVIVAHDGLTTTSGGYDQIEISTGLTSTQNVETYPWLVFDFDLMTPTEAGHQKTAYIVPRFKAGSTTFGYVTTNKVTFADLGLPNNPYEWHHVTVIYKFSESAVDLTYVPKFDISYYVDGKFVGEKETVDLSATSNWKDYITDGDFSAIYSHAIGFYSTGTTTPNEQQSAIDNLTYTAFPATYTEATIANYYNKNGDYELPFGKGYAKIGDTYYDDINEAVKAAGKDDVIYLINDVDEVATIEKAVVIDTNKYDAEGKATGEFYKIETTSQDFAPKTENGIITFTSAGEAKTIVYWDMCMCECEGETHAEDCECLCTAPSFPGHLLEAESEAVLGTAPAYPGEIPTFEMKDYKSITFAGWSRTPGGEVEEIVITDEDVLAEFILLYPVYDVVAYTFEVTDTSGNVTYHEADAFEEIMVGTLAPTGSTVKLLRDLDTGVGTLEFATKKTITLDLNGYDIRRCYVYGTSYKYSAGDSTDEVIETVAKGGNTLFSFGSVTGCKLYITSSAPGSDFYNTVINRNTWYDENGNAVKNELVESLATRMTYINKGTTTVDIRNISVYSTTLIGDGHATITKVNATVDNVNLYRTLPSKGTVATTDAPFYFCTKYGNLTVTNTKIFDAIAEGHNYFLYTNSKQTAMEGTITFNNCDIIFTSSKGAQGYHFTSETPADTQHITFENCRVYNVSNSSPLGAYLGKGTVMNDSFIDNARYPSGVSAQAKESTATYTVPETFIFAVDPTTGCPTFDFGSQTFEATFTYEVADAYTVNWYDANGELAGTTYVAKGETAVAPVEYTYVILEDAYRNGKYVWGNKEGTELANLVIDGTAAEYNFYAHKAIGENVDYVAGIKDAKLSFSYLTQFHTIVYFPVIEGMEAPKVSGMSTTGENVFIGGVEYWVYIEYASTVTVFDDNIVTANYEIEGKTYSQKFNANALYYAQTVLAAPESDAEALAVANMVRYVREALEAKEITTHDAAIIALIGTANEDGSTTGGVYSLPAYITEYPDATIAEDQSISKLFDYVTSVRYGMTSSSAKFIIDLTDDAVAKGVTVDLLANGVNPGVSASGNMRISTNIRVYDIVHPMTITLTVPGVDGAEPTVITATYSIGAYLAANSDVEVVKAMYAFGVAAGAYRETVK